VQATANGGAYEQFHIASQQEAFQFYYDLSGSNATLQPDTNGVDAYFTIIPALNTDGLFGDNSADHVDAAWFLSDESQEVGRVRLSNFNTRAEIGDYYNSIYVSDFFFLLVENILTKLFHGYWCQIRQFQQYLSLLRLFYSRLS
jgi:hypothetical protein